jgi:uncharacterized membrane protein YeaQ/YmgE (transglycosylase-associated protein family)
MKRIDFLGSGILVCAVFSLLLGLEEGGNASFSSPEVIALLVGSVLLFMSFVFVEAKVSIEPLAPIRIMMSTSLIASYLCNFFAFASSMAVVFNLSLYYQAVEKLSAKQAGLGLMPGVAAGVSGSLIAGVIMQKTGRYFVLTVVACITMLLGTIIVCLSTGLVFYSLAVNYVGK